MLRNLVKATVELQYIIELFADGMADGTGCHLSTSERLTRLLQLRARWRSLDWARVDRISTPTLCQAYELVDGVFASSRLEDEIIGSRHLALTWLPTSTNAEPKIIEREDVGVTIRDFAIDPSQDLMALLLKEEPPTYVDDLPPHTLELSSLSLAWNTFHNSPFMCGR